MQILNSQYRILYLIKTVKGKWGQSIEKQNLRVFIITVLGREEY